MRLLLMTWLTLSGLVTVARQQPVVLSGKLPGSSRDIGPNTSFYQDSSGDTLPLNIIRNRPFKAFLLKPNERAEFSQRSVLVTWLRFSIRNSHPTDPVHLGYYSGTHGLITLYEGSRRIGQTGLGVRTHQQATQFSLPLHIPPGRQQTYYVRVIDYFWSPTPVSATLLPLPEPGAVLAQPVALGNDLLLATLSLLTGCLLFMGLYAGYHFLLNRDRAFLYYAVYALLCVAFILHRIDFRFRFFLVFPARISDVLSPFHIASIGVFYSLFVAELLTLKTTQPIVWRILNGLLLLAALQEVQAMAEFIRGKPFFLHSAVYLSAMIPYGLATLLLMGVALRSRSAIRYYLLAGMVGLISIGLLPGSLDLYFPNQTDLVAALVNYPYFWLILGLSVEAFFFMLALAYRGRLIELENQRIQERYTQELETQLAERSREIQHQSRLLEAQHIRQLKAEFEQKLADTEMTALRAQMNPHFIFNCLNSIKLYILQNDADEASTYLTKFARLIRLVLENSRSGLVTLHDELEALQLYIELEAMRFKEKLRYQIRLSPLIDAQYICIPPLLIQPYVENAIWHGLMHKPKGGTLHIDVSMPLPDLLHIEIIDSGIGRQRAAEVQSKSAGKHKSFGMQVTADRIRMINQVYTIQTQAQVMDLVDSFGAPCGTRVIVEIPV